MRFASVCSGIESASVAWTPLGWHAAWFAETDKACSALLRKRFPDTPNHGDLTTLAARVRAGEVEPQELLVGGTPCQDFSIAGMRAGLSGARGALTLAYVDLLNAFDEMMLDPAIAVWENVPGVLNHKSNPFGNFLAALVGEDVPLVPSGKRWTDAGIVSGPQRTAAWRCLDAQYFGLAQRRKRVFVVASARNDFDPGEVLFEREGLRRDTPPSREAGQDVAGCLDARTTAGGFPGLDGACGNHVVAAYGGGNCSGPIAAAAALNASERWDFDSETFVCVTGDVTHALKAEGADASEAGTGRGNPIVAFMPSRTFGADGEIDSRYSQQDVCNALHTSSGGGNKAPLAVSLRGREGGGTAELGDQVSGCLRSSSGEGDKPHVLTTRVRRLMPIECERLQGFPDDWTAGQADGPRYKQLGNSKAVPVVRWIGERIARALTL